MSGIHLKTWGSENWMVNNDLYCGKILTVYQGLFCSLHAHKLKDETFYVRKGSVRLDFMMGINDEFNDTVRKIDGMPLNTVILTEGQSFRVPPLLLHRFTGLSEVSEIIEISTQHFEEDSYRVEPAYCKG